MHFKSFSELEEFIQRYNSRSVLEIGIERCWREWPGHKLLFQDWIFANERRNCSIRLMLLASAEGNHKSRCIDSQTFDTLIDAYRNWKIISALDTQFLEKESQILLESIKKWEKINEKISRNWRVQLSNIFHIEQIRPHINELYLQREIAFQNSGIGNPIQRIHRVIKIIDLLDARSEGRFAEIFEDYLDLNPRTYFGQLLAILISWRRISDRKGFLHLNQFVSMRDEFKEYGFRMENIRNFIQKNSRLFSARSSNSLRHQVNQHFDLVSDYYKPFLPNLFLKDPFIEMDDKEFCLPDPFSLSDSCWHQIEDKLFNNLTKKDENHVRNLLSQSFEDYLERILFPLICPNSFQKIPASNGKKRADFLMKTDAAYIVLECKNSVMNWETSAYFQADMVASCWCRMHSAFEQISRTISDLDIKDKPVIPLLLTFYDSTAASLAFTLFIRETSYFRCLGLSILPVVFSIHEFEFHTWNRSLSNWADMILVNQKLSFPVDFDNQGHNYKHLNDVELL